MTATTKIPGGSFTLDGGAWLDAASPRRCDLTLAQLGDLLALALDDDTTPTRHGFESARDILSDLMLTAQNSVRAVQRRADFAEAKGSSARAAVSRAWRVVSAAGKRKTLATTDVRAALEGDPHDHH